MMGTASFLFQRKGPFEHLFYLILQQYNKLIIEWKIGRANRSKEEDVTTSRDELHPVFKSGLLRVQKIEADRNIEPDEPAKYGCWEGYPSGQQKNRLYLATGDERWPLGALTINSYMMNSPNSRLCVMSIKLPYTFSISPAINWRNRRTLFFAFKYHYVDKNWFFSSKKTSRFLMNSPAFSSWCPHANLKNT
jgi:hypothetical protein